MGNEMSQEEEALFIEEALKMSSVDDVHLDQKLNDGTTAPNCQPRHTLRAAQCTEVRSNSMAPEPRGEQGAPPRRTQSENYDSRKRMGYIQMARAGYQELVNAIIRPPRAEYKMETLGPPAFSFCNRRFTRTDFTLRTKRGMNLECSHWEPVERACDRIPVVIYMHGNSSARVEVIPQLSYLLSLGLAVFSFDFAGSGKSDGEYVSLGYFEREDLMSVIAHLRATNVVSTIALWGRSMGAATALMHGDRDPSIACMILDSPFADLTQLAEEMVEKGKEQGISVPNFVVSVAIRCIQASVKRQANFNIRDISPIAHADKCFIPALFVAGEHDDFIHKRHSQAIHDKYAGDKNIIVVEGDHNSPRPKFMFDSVSIFLQTCLQIPSAWALKIHPGMNLMAPPWYYPGKQQQIHKKLIGASSQRQQAVSFAASNAEPKQEMGMTVERQREIQASLFKMLGQAEENTPPSSNKNSNVNSTGNSIPSSTKSASNTARDATSGNPLINSTHSSYSVNHAKTFPPRTEGDQPKASLDEDDIEN